MGEGPRTRTLAAGVGGVPCWRQELFNTGPSLRRNRGARGKERGAQTVPVLADPGRFLP